MSILGVDEVGRGPLAGPLVVGAVILPELVGGARPEWVENLKDSKKLSAKKREALNEIILKKALATGLGWVKAEEIDKIGISEALKVATRRAVKEVQNFHVPFSQIVIDGKVNFLAGTMLERYTSTLVKADDLIKEVSAASIIAKCARDKYMTKLARLYPGYGFEKHVGYGTALHIKALNELGLCPEHRRSYEPCKSMVGFVREELTVVKNTTLTGAKAEERVAEYLVQKGHEIVVKNFKTQFCEIDIISTYNNKMYFTEVKYRKSDMYGGGLLAVTHKKQQQMKFAAESFLNFYKKYKCFDPLLAVAKVSGEGFVVEDWFTLDFIS